MGKGESGNRAKYGKLRVSKPEMARYTKQITIRDTTIALGISLRDSKTLKQKKAILLVVKKRIT